MTWTPRFTAFAIFSAAGLSAVAPAVRAQALYLPGSYSAHFGDGLHIDKRKLGYYRTYKDNDNFDGIEYSQNLYQQNHWASQGEQVSYVLKSRDAQGNASNFAIGHNTQSTSHSLLTFDASILRRLGDSTSGEFTFNRDRVEVRQSLTNHVSADNFFVNIEQTFTDSLRGLATAGETHYTDGNHRPSVKLQATYDVLPAYGLSLQWRSRHFRNTNSAVTSGYYNPYKFVENIVAAEINQTVNGWQLSGNFGWGRQAGGNDPKTQAQAFEVSATAPVTAKVFVKAKAGYFRSLGYNAPDFLFRYVTGDVILVF